MTQPAVTQKRLGRVMIYLAWLLLLGLLTLYFADWLEQRENPNRELQSQTTATGVREVVLKRNRQGHYVAPGTINGQSVLFLLDTGATDVSIPAALAGPLQLKRGRPLQSLTANGVVTVYSTVAQQVALGDIVLENVRASLNPHMPDKIVLLGMSFMKNLELIQKGDVLTLRQY